MTSRIVVYTMLQRKCYFPNYSPATKNSKWALSQITVLCYSLYNAILNFDIHLTLHKVFLIKIVQTIYLFWIVFLGGVNIYFLHLKSGYHPVIPFSSLSHRRGLLLGSSLLQICSNGWLFLLNCHYSTVEFSPLIHLRFFMSLTISKEPQYFLFYICYYQFLL